VIIFEIYSFSTELFEKATNLDKETKINGLFAFLEEKKRGNLKLPKWHCFLRNKSNKNHYEY